MAASSFFGPTAFPYPYPSLYLSVPSLFIQGITHPARILRKIGNCVDMERDFAWAYTRYRESRIVFYTQTSTKRSRLPIIIIIFADISFPVAPRWKLIRTNLEDHKISDEKGYYNF